MNPARYRAALDTGLDCFPPLCDLCTFPHRQTMLVGAHYVIVDLPHLAELDLGRVTIMKHTLLREINQDMVLRSARRNLHALAVAHYPARIQGGNWNMQGFRRSGHVHDEAECELSIAEFMAGGQEHNEIVD